MPNKQVLISEPILMSLSSQQLTEAVTSVSGRFVVKTILQKANTKNANQRIYSKEVLDREIEKYIIEFVELKKAYGELDHCFCDSDFDVLTRNGWKNFNDVKIGEKVLSYNIKTKQYEYKKVINKISNEYAGEYFNFKGRNINTQVTPNHKFVIEDRYGKVTLTSAKEIFENRTKFNKSKILKTGNWISNQEKIILKGCIYKKEIFPYTDDLSVDSTILSGIVGIWLAEGHIQIGKNCDHGQVVISQNIGSKLDEIILLLDKSPFDYYIGGGENRNIRKIYIKDHRLFNYLKNLGNKYTKKIPQEIKNLNKEALEKLLYFYNLGDGRKYDSCDRKRMNVFTVSKNLINDLQECLIKSGKSGNITVIQQKECILSGGRIIIPTKDLNLNQLEFSSTEGIYLDDRFLSIENGYHEGNIYCLEIEDNNTFYVRHNGKCFITGNSEKMVVELKNVAINVMKIWWDGDTVWGDIEVLNTPSGKIVQELLKSGLTVGISSRGTGSVTTIDEETSMVDDDFSLLCFDCVSNPSTPGAYFLPKALNEGVEKEKMIESYSTINEMIGEILCRNLGFCECMLK